MNLLFNSNIVNLLLKTNVGREKVSGFIQGWGMQSESKISSFCF